MNIEWAVSPLSEILNDRSTTNLLSQNRSWMVEWRCRWKKSTKKKWQRESMGCVITSTREMLLRISNANKHHCRFTYATKKKERNKEGVECWNNFQLTKELINILTFSAQPQDLYWNQAQDVHHKDERKHDGRWKHECWMSERWTIKDETRPKMICFGLVMPTSTTAELPMQLKKMKQWRGWMLKQFPSDWKANKHCNICKINFC